MEETKSKVERQCSRKKHISTFTAKSDGSFYKTCDGCRAYNRARYHNKASPDAFYFTAHQLRVNARKNFENVLDELVATDTATYRSMSNLGRRLDRLYGKHCTEKRRTVERDIDYNDRCDGCEKHNDFCRCGPDFF